MSSHFPSGDRLLGDAAQHLAVKRGADTEERVLGLLDDQPDAVGGDRADRVVELLWQSFSEPHFWASVELWNAGIAQALRPEERRLGGAIRGSMARMFGDELDAHPRFKQVCDLLLTSMRGTALTYTFDPRDPAAEPLLPQWKNLVRTLL